MINLKMNVEFLEFMPIDTIDVASMTYYGLYALQHRGQESAGIAVADGEKIDIHKGLGLITEAFKQDDLEKLKGHIAIGHVRYSTAGGKGIENAQPILATFKNGTNSYGS